MSPADKSMPPQAERILVMRYRFIGDTILTVPFLRNLRRAYPHAQIDMLVGPQSGTVLDNCPYVNKLITFDTTRFHKYDSGEGTSRNFFDYVRLLRAEKYDTVFVLKRSLSSAVLAWLSGATRRIGYATEGRSFLLTDKVKWDPSIHEVASLLQVLQAVDIPVVDDHLECWLTPEELAVPLSMSPELAGPGLKVLFHAAAAHPDKTYPLYHWALMIKTLAARMHIKPVFVGAEEDAPLYAELEKLSGIKGINLVGKLKLRQSLALMKQVDLAICTDSGPAHMAAAAGTPVIALFGPTDPERWRPWGRQAVALFDESLPCRPCNYKKTCNDKRECLTELSPQRVVEAAQKILDECRHGTVSGATP